MKYEWTTKLKNVTYDSTSKEYNWSEEQTETEPYPILPDNIIHQQGKLYEFTTNHKKSLFNPFGVHKPTLPNTNKENKKEKE